MKISKTRKVKTPTRGTKFSAGLDFYIPEDFSWKYMCVSKGQSILIPSGIKANIPKGYALIAFNKSGVATKKGLAVGACVVDEDYQGEIHIHLINISEKEVVLEPGDKIIQFILLPVFYDFVTEVPESELYETETSRGLGGFGSTGDK